MLVIVAKLQAPFTSAHIITTSSWRPRRSRGIALAIYHQSRGIISPTTFQGEILCIIVEVIFL